MTHRSYPRTGESRRGHAHDREHGRVQTNLVTDDVGPARKAGLPQLAADDDDRMPARSHIVGGREEPSAIGGEAEDVEEVAGDEIADRAIGAVADVQAGGEAGPRRHALEGSSAVAKRGVHRIGEDTAVLLPLHVDQPIAIGHWEPLQECGVDDAEDGGVGADAEAERQDGREREAWPLPQHAGGVAQVLAEVGEQASGCARRDWLGRVRLTEWAHVPCERLRLGTPRARAACLGLAGALDAQLLVSILEMLRQLLHDLGFASGRDAARPGAGAGVAPVRHVFLASPAGRLRRTRSGSAAVATLRADPVERRKVTYLS